MFMESFEVNWNVCCNAIDPIYESIEGKQRIAVVPQHVPVSLIKGSDGDVSTFPISPQEAIARAIVVGRDESEFAFLVLIQKGAVVECASFMYGDGVCEEKSSVEFHMLEDYITIIRNVVEEIKERTLDYVLYVTTTDKHILGIVEFLSKEFSCDIECRRNLIEYLRKGCDVQYQILTGESKNLLFLDILGYDLWLQLESDNAIVYHEMVIGKDTTVPLRRTIGWPKIKIDKNKFNSVASIIAVSSGLFGFLLGELMEDLCDKYLSIDDVYKITGVCLLVKSPFIGDEFSYDITRIAVDDSGKLRNNIGIDIDNRKNVKIEF